MRVFVLQNPDYKELYWCEEFGWVDINTADMFHPSELDEDYCIDLRRKGRWVECDIKVEISGIDKAYV